MGKVNGRFMIVLNGDQELSAQESIAMTQVEKGARLLSCSQNVAIAREILLPLDITVA